MIGVRSAWLVVALAASCQQPCKPAPTPKGGLPPKAPAPEVSSKPPEAEAPKPAATPAERRRWCVTEGELVRGRQGVLEVATAKLRGIDLESGGDHARLRFRYRGPTAQQVRLASGAERRQLGLKLKAQDTCNLIYVMWRLVPEPKIVVSYKNNPGSAQHAQCGNHGYTNLTPVESRLPPPLVEGEEHELSADLRAGILSVEVDGGVVWRGELPRSALMLRGAVGVRSDNVAWSLVGFDAEPSSSAELFRQVRCRDVSDPR